MSFPPIRRLVATASLALISYCVHAAPLDIQPQEPAEPTFLMEENGDLQESLSQAIEKENLLAPSVPHWLLHEGFSHWLTPMRNSFAYQPMDEVRPLMMPELGGLQLETMTWTGVMFMTDEAICLSLDDREVTQGAKLAGLLRTSIPSDALLLRRNTLQFSLGSLTADPSLLRTQLSGVNSASPQASTCALLVVGLASVLFFRRRVTSH